MRHNLLTIGIAAIVLFFFQQAGAQHEKTHNQPGFKAESVLQEGQWYKVQVDRTGIHKLSYDKLEEIGFSNPEQVMVYAGAPHMLHEKVDSLPQDGLKPLPVLYQDNRLLFYACNSTRWTYDKPNEMFRITPHPYASFNTFFLYQAESASALREAEAQEYPPANPVNRDYFTDYTYHERNDTNLVKSGREWYGEKFDARVNKRFEFPMPDLQAGSPVKVFAEVIARSPEASSFRFEVGSSAKTIPISPVNYSYTARLANTGRVNLTAEAGTSDAVQVDVTYNKSSAASEGWLNRIVVHTRRNLVMPENELQFTGLVPEANDGIRFTLGNPKPNLMVWHVSDPLQYNRITAEEGQNSTEFSVYSGTRNWVRLVAFNTAANYPSPDFDGLFTGEVSNQNIHADETPELVIVTAPEFQEQARELGEFHSNQNGLASKVYTTEAIYNEFSGGKPDAGAIRNLLRMFYARQSANKLRYLVLFGDGSYNNLNYNKQNTNFIPTYQSQNSLSPTNSFVTDDFYGLLDIGEGGADGKLDIGIGRLPVQNTEEANVVLQKIKTYKNQTNHGLWRNKLCFIGDDEDGNLFMRQANNLAQQVEDNNSGFVLKKIMLDAYQQETTSSQESYPEATRELNDLVQNGVLMVNYVGHGAEDKLAEENLLTMSDIRSYTNNDRLTIFITATCEFSRFDDYRRASAGEEALLNANGGAAALFSTTRLVWAGQNYLLNQKFINHVFERTAAGEQLRLGDIIRKTKIDAGNSYNKRNFMLLGDPALKLAYATQQVVTDSVNGREAAVADTVGAMERVAVSGHIADHAGNKISGFNGKLFMSLYDKAQKMQTLANDDTPPFEFRNRTNLLYKGKASVENGRFTITFYVPKDIFYEVGTSKISYYAIDTATQQNARGGYKKLCIGGTAEEPVVDKQPPEIELYLNSPDFSPGDIVNQNPVLVAELTDDTGINTTNGIGHGISMTLDSAFENTIMLNNYYEASLDDYRSGKVTYRLSDLEPGRHSLKLKTWDIANKSAEKTIFFRVVGAEKPVVKSLRNYPNPFHQTTRFYFKHNLSGNDITVLLHIYDRFGRVVRQLSSQLNPEAYYNNSLTWNATDAGGSRVSNGIYFYRLTVKNEIGKTAVKSGRMLFLHQ